MLRYLTLRELSQRLGGRSRSAIYSDLDAGRLPRPVRIGGRIYWPEDELAEHLRRTAEAQRDARGRGQ